MIEVNDAVVNAVVGQMQDADPAQVRMVLNALNSVTGGEPPGTVMMNAAGAVAMRVSEGGVHSWRVTETSGSTWADMNPTLSGEWTVVSRPEGSNDA